MLDREQCVREIAHRLWEEEGRPTDQEKRHWATAEEIFDAQARLSRPDSQPKVPHQEMRDTAGPADTSKRRKARKARTAARPQDSLILSG